MTLFTIPFVVMLIGLVGYAVVDASKAPKASQILWFMFCAGLAIWLLCLCHASFPELHS